MTDKKKIAELLRDVEAKGFWQYGFDHQKKVVAGHDMTSEDIADYLVENGVTIQRWIPVTERLPEELPKDNCAWSERVRPSVDVLVKIKGLKALYTAWYSYSYKEWTDVREERSFTGVTHWMPLPEPPKEK